MSVLEVLAVTVPVLLTVAFVTIAERKTMASMQRRLGPNAVGWYGLLQAFADALKLLLKEYVSPTQANIVLFFLGPIITLIFSLLGYAVVPYGPGLVLLDYNLGILYMLAVSSLATYGILLAGWSANSKYAFLGSNRPVKGASLYLEQTISEKFRKQNRLLTLIGTLCDFFIRNTLIYNPFYHRPFSSLSRKATDVISNLDTEKDKTPTAKSSSTSNLHPHFVTGFCDAEGCFILSIYKNNKPNSKLTWRVQHMFVLHLHIKDLELLESIKSFFGVGVLVVDSVNNKVRYSVNSIEDLKNVIIPHFDKYPLQTKKYVDYSLFKSAVLLVKERKHYTTEGLHEIVSIRASMNKGLTETLNANFSNITPFPKPLSIVHPSINNHWLLGFIEGEGCFFVSLSKNPIHEEKHHASLLFKLTQHHRDVELIRLIGEFLGCGFIVEESNASTVSLNCRNLSYILQKIIPFLDNYRLMGHKRLDYADFYKVAKLMENKSHLTTEGLNEIKVIKTGMNRGRKEAKILSQPLNQTRKMGYHTYAFNASFLNCVTPFKWGSKVKILFKMNNPQVTKAFNSLVGTSEAIRLLSILLHKGCRFYRTKVNYPTPTKQDQKWNQWLAGLIDGDGYFHLTKKGYASLEITMDIRDEHALQIIKNVYGGSIKLVSGLKALRYCLRHKEGFLALVNDVNGEIRNSNRLMQLNKICLKYEIALIYSEKLTYNNGWLSGFFDADGSVTLNSNNGQLAITLTQKTSEILQPLLDIYGGSIYIDRASNNFKWYISDKEGIINLISYFKKYHPRSLKKNRLHLIPRCYELKEIGAHKALEETHPLLAKSWVIFKAKWAKYED